MNRLNKINCIIILIIFISLFPLTCYGMSESSYIDNEESKIKITTSPIELSNLQMRTFTDNMGKKIEYLSLPEGTRIKISPASKDITYRVKAVDKYVQEDGIWCWVEHFFTFSGLNTDGYFVDENAGGVNGNLDIKGDIEFTLPQKFWGVNYDENEVLYELTINQVFSEKNEYYHFYCKVDSETPVVGNFTDVKKYHYFYEPVVWAVDNEITSGIDDEHFAPNMVTTRAQMVTFLWRAAGSPTVKNVKNDFEDVSKDSYYYDAVMWAVKNGITTGVTETEFKPDDAVTRAQAVTFLWRNAGGPEAAGETAFKDVVSESYYEQAVKWAVGNSITTGMTADKFAPNDSCTRAQIVTFLYRNSMNESAPEA